MNYRWPLLLGLLCCLTAAPGWARGKDAPPPALSPLELADPPKTPTTGIYQDGAGGLHPWSITDGHALEWDKSPYLPVGGAFTPRFWAEGATDGDWDADKAVLDSMRTHGVHDLYLYAGERGLTHVPPASVQKVLDYLDASGFHYGIEIADFPKDPLIGYVVKPAVYRDPSPPLSGPSRFSHIPGLASAFYMLVSPHDLEVDESGTAQVTGSDTAVVGVKSGSADDVLLLYPERLFFAGSPESHLPDLWQGYDEYRDRLLGFFGKIKLGPGFRFFLDPLVDKIGFQGEVQNLIPTTDGYRLEFQAWLNKKYGHNIDDLNNGWGIRDRDLPDFATAARSLPLWYQARGVPAVYDPVKRVSYAVLHDTHRGIGGHLWQDLTDFRTESTRGYMNAVADVLKKGVADVPVVYKWSGRSPLFTNNRQTGGFDGLGMEAYGHGRALTVESGAYTYAQAEETPKTTWLIVSGTGEAEQPSDKAGPGYSSKAALFNDWDDLEDIGARGFFAQALQRLPLDKNSAINLGALPDQLGWLGAFAQALQPSAAHLEDQRPRVLWYPAEAPGIDADIRQFRNGVWWLPSYRPGSAIQYGPALHGYSLPDPSGLLLPTYVVWSPHNALTKAQFPLGKKAQPIFLDSGNQPLLAKEKNNVWTIPVGADPIQIKRVRSLPLPVDAADAAEAEAARLIKLASDEKIDTQRFQDQFFYARNHIPGLPENADLRFTQFANIIAQLSDALRPYTWIEAENASKYTFDSIVVDAEASSGAYLSLSTDRPPPRADADSDSGYRAEYKFSVNAPGRYAIWMAGSPLGTPDASPISYSIDGGPASDGTGATTEGEPYAGKFVWNRLGETTLSRGPHTLVLSVTDRRARDNQFVLSVDAFCLTRAPFHPDGPRRPPIDIPPPAPPDKKDKDRDTDQ